MKTYSAKPSDVTRKWYVVDASDLPLGRLCSEVSKLLLGKGKPIFTRHIDTGDYVIVINAAQVAVTGTKLEDKKYYRYSGYPSGLTQTSLKDQLTKDPTQVILHGVKGMLPANRLLRDRLARLKIYATSEHNHAAQSPELLNLKKGK